MVGLVYFLLSVGAIMVVIMVAILLERIYKARGGGDGWSIGSRFTDAEIRRDVRLEAQRTARIQKDIQRMFASHDRSSGHRGE